MSEFQSSDSNQAQEGEELLLYFCGSRYDFTTSYGRTWLEIKATLRGSSKRSCINTLNFILSAFDIDPNSNNAENPEWSGSVEQVQTWAQTAQSLFVDELFLQSLERALDEDRREGEWEED